MCEETWSLGPPTDFARGWYCTGKGTHNISFLLIVPVCRRVPAARSATSRSARSCSGVQHACVSAAIGISREDVQRLLRSAAGAWNSSCTSRASRRPVTGPRCDMRESIVWNFEHVCTDVALFCTPTLVPAFTHIVRGPSKLRRGTGGRPTSCGLARQRLDRATMMSPAALPSAELRWPWLANSQACVQRRIVCTHVAFAT